MCRELTIRAHTGLYRRTFCGVHSWKFYYDLPASTSEIRAIRRSFLTAAIRRGRADRKTPPTLGRAKKKKGNRPPFSIFWGLARKGSRAGAPVYPGLRPDGRFSVLLVEKSYQWMANSHTKHKLFIHRDAIFHKILACESERSFLAAESPLGNSAIPICLTRVGFDDAVNNHHHRAYRCAHAGAVWCLHPHRWIYRLDYPFNITPALHFTTQGKPSSTAWLLHHFSALIAFWCPFFFNPCSRN